MTGINGGPFLTYLLDQLDKVGMRKVILCTGYMACSVEDTLGKKYKNLEIIYSVENESLGTAGALKFAYPFLVTEQILVMNGDSFVEYDVYELFSYHLKKEAVASIVLAEVDDVSRYGEIEVNSEGEVRRFAEKGDKSGVGWINAGVYLMKKDVLNTVPDETPFSLERQIFPSLIGKELYGYKANRKFIDIGTPESYAVAGDFLRQLTLN